ncbi:MAG: alpha/beta hydrolase, partial [Bacilli bacterium]|nr:alpha/beta hydrolase [Bacilli bacterium]
MFLSFFASLFIALNSSNLTYQNRMSYLNLNSGFGRFESMLSDEEYGISDVSSITVFTHGMGGDYSHWLQNNNLYGEPSYEEDRLPFLLSDTVYVLNYDGTFYKVDTAGYIDISECSCISPGLTLMPATSSIDLNKHIVIVYNGRYDCSEYISNSDLYADFERTLDSFLYYLSSSLEIIPKINLIGHSRGGIINMMYASEHIQIVDNLISIATPYFGTDWLRLASLVATVAPNMAIDLSCYSDFLDFDFSESLLETWNDAYRFSDSHAKAIGCKQSYEFFVESISSVIHSDVFYSLLFPDGDSDRFERERNLYDIETLWDGVSSLLSNGTFVSTFQNIARLAEWVSSLALRNENLSNIINS